MKISDKKLGDFYGLHRNTILNYRSKEDYKKIYEALLAFYLKKVQHGM